MANNPETKSWLRLATVGVVLVLVAGMFALGEIVVRVRQWVKYGMAFGIEETYTDDPVSGLRVPVAGGTFGPIRINSLGFRGPELVVPKAGSTLRIAYVGSSTTYCAEVSGNDATWPHIVTAALRKKWPAVPMDYINAGVPGFTAKTTIENVGKRVHPLNPDVIVIYEGHNDISRNSFELAVKDGLITRRLEQELMWPSRYSLLWNLVEKNLHILNQQRLAHATVSGKLNYQAQTLVAPFGRDLNELVSVSQRSASLVAVATLSNRLRKEQTRDERTRSSVTHLYYMPYMSPDGLIDAYTTYNNEIRQVARERGALLISGEDTIPGDGEHFVDSIHFTDKGSMAMADRVIAALVASDSFHDLVKAKLKGSSSGDAGGVESVHASFDRVSRVPPEKRH
jgi:lysophospholipase L1-like esterase